jgi:hypothetical protein
MRTTDEVDVTTGVLDNCRENLHGTRWLIGRIDEGDLVTFVPEAAILAAARLLR